MTTMVSRALSVHKEHELLLRLETAGLDDKLAQRIIDSKDNDLAARVVRLIKDGGFALPTLQERAYEIMGLNFFGIEEAIRNFGLSPSRAEIDALYEVPFTEEVLTSLQDTHVLVAVFPMSILDICDNSERNLVLDHGRAWYNGMAFAKEEGEVGWRLVRKAPVSDSTSKGWDEQQALLNKNEETPSARVMVYTIIGHFLAIGEHLFEDVQVRTSSVDSDSNRVDVGTFHVGSLHQRHLSVTVWLGGASYTNVGVSSARKPRRLLFP